MIPRLDSGSGGGGTTDTTDDSTDSDTSTSDGSSTSDLYDHGGGGADQQSFYSNAGSSTSWANDIEHNPEGVGNDPDPTDNIDAATGDPETETGNTDTSTGPTVVDNQQAAENTAALENTLRIEGGEGVDGEYSFRVSGEVDHAGTPNPEDTVTENGVEGSIWRGVDEYRFSGRLTSISLPEGATAYVNGEEVSGGGLPDLSAMGLDLPGGTVALPGIGEVPVAGLVVALLAVVAAMEG